MTEKLVFTCSRWCKRKLEWDDFLDFKLPIPSVEKQQEIVNEYHTIQNRINLNNQLIAKLEETAQTIYKQWFVDFEFPFDFAQGKPSENGKPYKSNGGKWFGVKSGEGNSGGVGSWEFPK